MTAQGSPLPRRRGPLARAALALAASLALGLVLQQQLAERLAAIDALARQDLLRARGELAFLLRAVGCGVFGLTGAVGVALIAASRRAIAVGQFPPPGVWSFGRGRPGAGLTWWMAAVLLACRAT
jgi:hypothetical protein